jgi:hypothetical protein
VDGTIVDAPHEGEETMVRPGDLGGVRVSLL